MNSSNNSASISKSNFKQTIIKFLNSLSKIKDLIPVLVLIRQELSKKTWNENGQVIYNQMKPHEKMIFDDKLYVEFFKQHKLFFNLLDLSPYINDEFLIHHVRMIYINAMACENTTRAKEFLNSNKASLRKKSTLSFDESINKLPPNIGNIVKSIGPELQEMSKNVDFQKINPTDPVGSILNSGLDITKIMSNMNNLAPVIKEHINKTDEDELAKELASMLKMLKH